MHPPLRRPHPKCHEVVKVLLECHEANPYGKFFGACNDEKAALDKCFAEEKEEKRAANFKKARQFDEAYQRELELRKEEIEEERREMEAAKRR